MASINRSYCTPDGHAVTHAMHPKHVSMCRTKPSESAASPSRPTRIRWMRPRGESISLCQRTYVGLAGKQKPQWTQSATRSREGGCWESKIPVEGLVTGLVVCRGVLPADGDQAHSVTKPVVPVMRDRQPCVWGAKIGFPQPVDCLRSDT